MVNPDSFDREVIRRIVHSFYERKEYPTLSKVLERVKEECSFPGGKFCLSRVIHELGFSYKQRNMKQYVYEQRNVLEQRHTYLQTIRKLRADNRTLVYMDETWVNAHHTNNYIWVDSDGKGGWKVPSGKGQRLIIVHAGSAEGWVEGADLVFKSKTKSADYHDEMNSEHFMEWFTKQLLPNIPDNAVIVIDNATYHNKQKDKAPTTSNRKDEIQKWLDEHNVTYSPNDIKKTLLEKVKENRPAPLYLTNEAATNYGHGHSVVRLPVAHCELNPIEMAWSWVKGYVRKHNKTFTLTEVQQLTNDAFKAMPADTWRHYCRHVIDVENNYFDKDGIYEDTVEEMIIDLGEDDSDSECDSDIEELLDDDDRQLIDTALALSSDSRTDETRVESNARRDLSDVISGFDPDFLASVLPLPSIAPDPAT